MISYILFRWVSEEMGVQNHMCTVPVPSWVTCPKTCKVFVSPAQEAAGLLCCDGALLACGEPPPFRYLLVCLSLTTSESSESSESSNSLLLKGRCLQNLVSAYAELWTTLITVPYFSVKQIWCYYRERYLRVKHRKSNLFFSSINRTSCLLLLLGLQTY